MVLTRRPLLAGLLASAAAPSLAAAAPRVRKEVLGFYYGWYANPTFSDRWVHWSGPTGTEAPAEKTPYDAPVLGLYDSHDPKVVAQHALWAKQAGLTGVISGQWGRGTRPDKSTEMLLGAMHAQGLKVSVYIEGQKDGVAGAVADLRQLLTTHARHPAWLTVGGRPVVFLYTASMRALPAKDWRAAAKTLAAEGLPEAMLIGDVDPTDAAEFADRAPWLDATHVYVNAAALAGKTPAQMTAYTDTVYPDWKAKAAGKIYCVTVSPGYNDTKTVRPGATGPRPVVDRFGTDTLASQWRAAMKTGADWVLITSFNAWNDGTELEPSKEWGEMALDANRRFAQAFLAGRTI